MHDSVVHIVSSRAEDMGNLMPTKSKSRFRVEVMGTGDKRIPCLRSGTTGRIFRFYPEDGLPGCTNQDLIYHRPISSVTRFIGQGVIAESCAAAVKRHHGRRHRSSPNLPSSKLYVSRAHIPGKWNESSHGLLIIRRGRWLTGYAE